MQRQTQILYITPKQYIPLFEGITYPTFNTLRFWLPEIIGNHSEYYLRKTIGRDELLDALCQGEIIYSGRLLEASLISMKDDNKEVLAPIFTCLALRKETHDPAYPTPVVSYEVETILNGYVAVCFFETKEGGSFLTYFPEEKLNYLTSNTTTDGRQMRFKMESTQGYLYKYTFNLDAANLHITLPVCDEKNCLAFDTLPNSYPKREMPTIEFCDGLFDQGDDGQDLDIPAAFHF